MQIYFSDPLFFYPLCLQILQGHFDTDSNSFTYMMNASRPGALHCKRNLSSSSRRWLTRWVQSAWNSMLMEVSSLLAARTLISFEIRLILSRIEMILPGMIVSIRSFSEILSALIFTFITVLRIFILNLVVLIFYLSDVREDQIVDLWLLLDMTNFIQKLSFEVLE